MKRRSATLFSNTQKIITITTILITEHTREPTALLWSAIAPCLLFVITTLQHPTPDVATQSYTASAAWFYSYISASVAFFGFSFYLIGRRESGFVRSFIYEPNSILRFLLAHSFSYSIISIAYASLFYLITKPLYGNYSIIEPLHLLACFYTSYLLFTCIGLGIAALPIKFSTASTLFSLMSFLMLISGYSGATQSFMTSHSLILLNPLYLSTRLFNNELPLLSSFVATLAAALSALYFTGRYFRIQPIWSRY